MLPAKLILLVDDIPDHVTRYQTALARHGFRVQLARTGRDALQLARASLPDCAVIDLRLPDMSGWDLCHQIKLGDGQSIRVIVLTPEVSKMSAADSAKAGCNAWLTHPTAPEVLVDTVKQVLDMRTDEPASPDDAVIGTMTCAGCGSESVRTTLRVGPFQYYCCKACSFSWRAEVVTTEYSRER
jgi:DNA-binding response OmpR family regulator